MPRKAKENNFKEFKFKGENGNEFSGRVYDAVEGKNSTKYGLSITCNGLAIVGASFVQTDKTSFVAMPQYKTKSGDYKSQCYFYNKEDLEDMTALAKYLDSVVE